MAPRALSGWPRRIAYWYAAPGEWSRNTWERIVSGGVGPGASHRGCIGVRRAWGESKGEGKGKGKGKG